MAQSLTLYEAVAKYEADRDIKKNTRMQLVYSVRSFHRYFVPRFGREATLADLTDDLVNEWLLEMKNAGKSQAYIRTQRVWIVTLWRASYEAERCETFPKRVRRIKKPEGIPEAWTPEQVRLLLAAASTLTGYYRFTGYKKSLWWTCFILVAWDTALRLGDLLTIRSDQITPDGRIVLVQAKTGWVHEARLRPETMAALTQLGTLPREGCILPWNEKTLRHLFTCFREILKVAGLRGSSRWLRRSSATAIEQQFPGAAMAHLGHRTPGLAYKHYVDPRLVQRDKPLPPPLDFNLEAGA